MRERERERERGAFFDSGVIGTTRATDVLDFGHVQLSCKYQTTMG